MNRRTIITTLAAAAGSVIVPVSLAASRVGASETGYARVRRLQKELSVALAELAAQPAGNDYVSIVLPTGAARHTRALMDRDVWDSEQARLVRTARMEVAAHEWCSAVASKDQALAAYSALGRPAPIEHPLRSAYIDADDAADAAKWRLLNLIVEAAA